MSLSEDIEQILQHSQGINENLDLTDIIYTWEHNKRFFTDASNGKLVFEYPEPITITLTEKQKEDMFRELVEEAYLCYGENFRYWLLSNKDGFFSNKTVIDCLGIKKNSKLIKNFKKFITDPQELRNFQDYASRIIQSNKIQGILGISVHPLDFLTMSENNCGWRSCQSLDGDYRAATISYMMDDCTIVCYLRSENLEHLQCLPDGMVWNNKKWRMLVHCSNNHNAWYYNKQYPFFNNNLMMNCYKMLCELFNKDNMVLPLNLRVKFLDNMSETLLWYNHKIYKAKDLCIAAKPILLYNDFVYSSIAPRYISTKEGIFNLPSVIIGRSFKCPATEKIATDPARIIYKQEEKEIEYCTYCGRRIYDRSSAFYDDDGTLMCKYCNSEIIKWRKING